MFATTLADFPQIFIGIIYLDVLEQLMKVVIVRVGYRRTVDLLVNTLGSLASARTCRDQGTRACLAVTG